MFGIDLEFSSFDPTTGKIYHLAVVDESGLILLNYYPHQNEFTPFILEHANHLVEQCQQSSVSEHDAIVGFWSWYLQTRGILVGHAPGLDFQYLYLKAKQYSIPTCGIRYIDTCLSGRQWYLEQSITAKCNLSELYFQLTKQKLVGAHDAVCDAHATLKIAQQLPGMIWMFGME